MRSLAVAFALAVAACSEGGAPPSAVRGPAASAPLATAAPPAESALPVVSAAPAAPAAPSGIPVEEARGALFPDGLPAGACKGVPSDEDPIRCAIIERYRSDPKAETAAVRLFERSGSIAGLERDQMFDGGYRGTLHLVPNLPVGKDVRHLEWLAAAHDDFDVFFRALESRAPSRVRFRHRAILYRFFRSVNARTPTAFAHGWTVSYNVAGSLLVSADAARETLFHELFHLNDARSVGSWSEGALSAIYDGIVRRCGTRMDCLKPYTPGETTVRGGTYYAFQPGNGVHEYAAELALRYYREERAALAKKPVPRAFRCGPPENEKAMKALSDEFFGGFRGIPPCFSD